MTILSTIFNIHKEAPAQEDVLAFLTGQEEIRVHGVASEVHRYGVSDRSRLEVVTLYAAEPVEQQQQVFKRTGANCRKVRGFIYNLSTLDFGDTKITPRWCWPRTSPRRA